jgi:hypothetical protein
VVSLLLAGLGGVSGTAGAQMPPPPSSSAGSAGAPVSAPVPDALLTGRSVFISNAGADSGLFPQPFTGYPDRGYSEFYALVQKQGRFVIVDDPSKADLVFELRLMAPNGPANPNKEKGASDPLPMFRLVIYQEKTHYVLWAFTESIDPALLQKAHDRNFDLALDKIINDLGKLTNGNKPRVP